MQCTAFIPGIFLKGEGEFPRWGSLCTPPDPIAAMGAYFYGEGWKGRGSTSKGDGREKREERRDGNGGDGIPPPKSG